MRKSINEFNSILNDTEKLSTSQLYLVRGGDGEDLRRNTGLRIGGSTTTTPDSTTTTTISTTASIDTVSTSMTVDICG